MTFSTTARLGCLATLAMTISLQSWSAERFFQPIEQPLGSIAPIVLSDSDLRGNTTKGYRPWFENGTWQGDLVEYSVTSDGVLSTSVDFSSTSPTNSGSNWSALVQFAAKNDTYWDTRKIITFNGGTQVPFRFTDDGIGADNKALLEPGAADDASNILDYVRGDRSNEYPNGTFMRKRTSILGDIIHSKPVYVAAPNANRTDNNYAEWVAGKVDRAPRVYVGANDGMLHVFDADNGDEVYAYVPSMLISSLPALTARPYKHRYFVDGEMSVRDAYFNSAWHTVLAGSLGAGGKGFFVLDITDPDLSSETANTGDNKKVLFEFDASADADLGDSFSRPMIAKLNDGDWYVVVGNGYNSANGVAKLYLLNLDTGGLTKISTRSGTAENPNGLSSPALLDTDRDGSADYAYAGDIDGNLWKFDLSGDSVSDWELAYSGSPVHPGSGDQSIVHAPQITRHPQNGYMLYFATGRLITNADLGDSSVQSLYGIWDSGNPPPSAANQSLLTQIWDGPKTYNYNYLGEEEVEFSGSQSIAIYNEDAGNPDWETQHGWKIDLPAVDPGESGYRVLQPVQVRANRVKATVYKPTAIAGQLGENWLVEALLTDGGPNPPAAPIYDLNIDGVLNNADLYDNNSAGEIAEWHVPMMWRQADGLMSEVTIAFLGSGSDTLFINYLQQPVTEDVPCTATQLCPNGFLGGHIDVQTYHGNVPLDGDRTAQSHQYDSITERVYVDFFDLYHLNGVYDQVDIDFDDSNRSGSFGNPPTTASNINDNEEFIVLLANADLSPGSTLRIGNKEWNVVEYQRQIHNALKNWDPTIPGSIPLDADGDSLVFTWRAIKNAGGTISHNFDDRAILDAGLHPTQPECVMWDSAQSGRDSGDRAATGRWRNGALTTQLVKKSYFTDNPVNPAIAMVNIQQPVDLPPFVITADGDRVDTSIDYEDDLYETVGGLLAQHDAEHIWEGTLFWHFGDLTDIIGLGRPCYGDPDWDEAVAFELSNDPISATLEALGKDVTSDTLATAIETLRLQGCDDAGAACNAEWTLLKSIFDLSKDYTRRMSESGFSPPPVPPEPLPIVIPGTIDAALTEGILYEPGRMSWTDVVK